MAASSFLKQKAQGQRLAMGRQKTDEDRRQYAIRAEAAAEQQRQAMISADRPQTQLPEIPTSTVQPTSSKQRDTSADGKTRLDWLQGEQDRIASELAGLYTGATDRARSMSFEQASAQGGQSRLAQNLQQELNSINDEIAKYTQTGQANGATGSGGSFKDFDAIKRQLEQLEAEERALRGKIAIDDREKSASTEQFSHTFDRYGVPQQNTTPKSDMADSIDDLELRAIQQQIEQIKAANPEIRSFSDRLGYGLESLGLNLYGTPGVLAQGVKQSVEQGTLENEYQNPVEQLEYTLNLMRAYGGEGSPEYQQTLAEYEAAKAKLSQAQQMPQWDAPIDINHPWLAPFAKGQEYAYRATEGVEGVPGMLGNAALSIGQNLTALPSAVISPGAPLAIMGAQAAAGRAYELSTQGVGAQEALSRGVTSGLIEAATEKIPLDNLLDAAKGINTGFISAIIKQSGMEATEEAVAYTANYVADKLAGDENAQFTVSELLESAAMGAISGGFFGVGGVTAGAINARNRAKQPDTVETIETTTDTNVGSNEQAQATEESPATAQEDDLEASFENMMGAIDSQLAPSQPDALSGALSGMIQAQRRAVPETTQKTEKQIAQDTNTISEAADVFGKNGQQAFKGMYIPETQDTAAYFEGMTAFYNAGTQSADINDAIEAKGAMLNQSQKDAAYLAGVADSNIAAQAKMFGEQSGLQKSKALTNSKVPTEVQNELDALGKVLGVQVQFEDKIFTPDGSEANASYQSGVLKISANSDLPVVAAAIHESVHRVREVSPEAYAELSTYILNALGNQTSQWAKSEWGKSYSGLSSSDITEEVIADAVAFMLNDTAVLSEFVQSEDNRTTLQKIIDAIADIIASVKRALSSKSITLSEGQKTAFSALQSDLEGLQKAYTDAVRTAESKAKTKTASEGESEGATRFSVKQPVEQTKELIALHNLNEKKMQGVLELGGFVMPSIAIIDAGGEHLDFGDITVVFPKSAIDPSDKANKVYGGDAWTPTMPSIGYEVNETVQKRIRDKYYALVRSVDNRDIMRPLQRYTDDVADALSSHGGEQGLIDWLANETDMMQVYLVDNGQSPVKAVEKEIKTRLSDEQIAQAEFIIDALGADAVNDIAWKGAGSPKEARDRFFELHGEKATEALKQFYQKQYDFSWEESDNAATKAQVITVVREALKYLRGGAETVTTHYDYEATQEAIKAVVNQDDYIEWLNDLFGGVENRKGVRNNKDYYTASGNRRSFAQLYDEYNIDNILAVMKKDVAQGQGSFGSGNIFGISAKQYKSIKEIKQASGRLQTLSENDYQEIKKELEQRFFDIASSIQLQTGNPFTAFDNAVNAIVDAVRVSKTVEGIERALQKDKQWLNLQKDTAQKVAVLVAEIAEMPTGYFEAKPQRAIRFDEVLAVVAPADTNTKLVRDMQAAGLNVELYNDDAQRRELVNNVEGAKFSKKGTEDAAEAVARLKRENARLETLVDKLAQQSENKSLPIISEKSIKDLVKRLKSGYSVKLTKAQEAEFNEMLRSLGDFIVQNGTETSALTYQAIKDSAMEAAGYLIDKSSVLRDDYSEQDYKELREYLRTTAMSFTDKDSIADFNDFRKRNFGKVRLVNAGGIPVDVAYQELQGRMPGYFPEGITHPADQLEHMINMLDSLAPVYENPYSFYMASAVEELSLDIIDTMLSEDIPQQQNTYATRAQARTERQIARVKEQTYERVKKATEKERERRDAQVAEVKRDYNAREEGKEKTRVNQMIAKEIGSLYKKLNRPSDSDHVPDSMREIAQLLLDGIGIEGQQLDIGARKTAILKLKKELSGLSEEITVDPDLIEQDGMLDIVFETIGESRKNLTLSQVQEILNAVRAVKSAISSADQLFSTLRGESRSDMANQIREATTQKNKKEWHNSLTKTQHLLTLDNLTPMSYFHEFGPAGDAIYRGLRDAEDKVTVLVNEMKNTTQAIIGDTDVRKLGEDIHKVTLGGVEFEMSTAMIMHMYVLSKRKKALDHMKDDGIFPEAYKAKGRGKKIRVTEPSDKVTSLEMEKAFSLLTAEQIKIADALQAYMTNRGSELGNEASMQMYGYKKFLEKIYWPIKVARDSLRKNIAVDTAATSIKNYGMTKQAKDKAKNPIVITNIFDSFEQHMVQMATYNAFLAVTEDLNAIRNYKWRDEVAGKNVQTMSSIIRKIHGDKGEEYIHKLLVDLAYGTKAGSTEYGYGSGIFGNFKAAAVAWNISVMIQQPTAYFKIFDMIEPKYATMAAGKNPVSAFKRAKKYAPIAQWKDWGYFDTHSGRAIKDLMFNTDSRLSKIKASGMAIAGLLDSLTWGGIWLAVEAETKAEQKSLKPGSKDFYEAVALRFTEIVDGTQVVDSIMHRSQIMRNPGLAGKWATSFMSEPTIAYNMVFRRGSDARNAKTPEQKATANKRLAIGIAALTTSVIVNAIARSLNGAFRDDDKEKDYWERFFDSLVGEADEEEKIISKITEAVFGGNLQQALNPATYIPFFKDAVSLAQGFDVERMDMAVVDDIINSGRIALTALTGEGKHTVQGSLIMLLSEVAQIKGLPIKNVRREVEVGLRSIAETTGNIRLEYEIDKFFYDLTKVRTPTYQLLYKAKMTDPETYTYMYNDMLKNGFESKDINLALDRIIADKQGKEKLSELETRVLSPTQETKRTEMSGAIESSAMWSEATSEQQQGVRDSMYDLMNQNSAGESMSEKITGGAEYGLTETDYLLYRLALEMQQDPEDEHKVASQDEAEAAIELMDGLSEEVKAYLWQSTNAGWNAKNNPYN